MTRKQMILIPTIVAIILILIAACQPEPTYQALGTTNFTNVTAEDLTATDDLSVGDDATITDALTVTGAAALNGGLAMDTNKFTVANTSGNTVVAGTFTATGATALNGGLAMDTNKFTVADTSGNTDIAGTLQYGANDLYALGFATSGQQTVYGTQDITGTATAAHGLTTVTFALCTLGEDPTSGAGDSAMCSVAVSGNTVTLKAWQDDFVTAATEADTTIQWIVIGAP